MDTQTDNTFLSRLYPPGKLQSLIKSFGAWHPYPPAADRAGWAIFPEAFRKLHVESGERAMQTPFPLLPADVYLQFARNGNRSNYEAPYFARRTLLAQMLIAECMEGHKRFTDAIANAIWGICEESSWCLPAHINAQKAGSGLPDTREPIVDLFAAETSSLLAWCYYLLYPQLNEVSPLVPERIEREIQGRILTPVLERDDFWWMGFGDRSVNNWNPWINSNWLTSVLLVEKDEARRIRSVHKILRSLDRFLVPYPDDGGCDEGPSYWTRAGASLYDCLELLHSASGGVIDVYHEHKVQEIGRFIYRAHIDESYYVNFADAPARLTPEPALVYGYGKRIGDTQMMSFGAWLARQTGLIERGVTAGDEDSPGRLLAALFTIADLAGADAKPALVRDVWLDQIRVMAARGQSGSSRGLYLAAKGGHNEESHNHNDVGHFIVYADGKPLIIDAGVGTYTRKTFSPQRYEIWTMQSAYHSLPTIDGVMQAPGRQYRATAVHYHADDQSARFSLNIATAYPAEAKLKDWQRSITLQRGKYVELVDSYELLSAPQELTLSLLTPCRVDASAAGKLVLAEETLVEGRRSASGTIEYAAGQFTVAVERIDLDDEQLRAVWGDHLTRLLFKVIRPAEKGSWAIRIRN